ncbi:MAG: hypothetical protein FD134_1992 [Gallionellaceae bacterium]|nr:MAG: hypothetical protein FD134_1992 [Gallionellaceae bacterium]
MVEVIVFAEGQTEEQFIKRLLAPAFRPSQIFLKPQQLNTSQNAKGGAISFDRLKFNARNTLRQKPDATLTTFLDLYGLNTDFPGYTDAKKLSDVYARTAHLEAALHREIVAHVGCRADRFIPHVQPYEFEGLLFSNVETLVGTEPSWKNFLPKLKQVRASFISPEHINDNYETKPSKRLEDILSPKYKKTRHGPLAAEKITLAVMEQECTHFKGWLDKLRQLGA